MSEQQESSSCDSAGDPELMRRAGRGDRQAMAVLVRRHQRKILALAYRFLGRWEDAEDVCQEAFVRLFRAAPTYQPTAEFSTWLYRVVANLCWDRRRRAGRAAAVPLGDADHPITVTSDSGAALLEQAERRQRVRMAVAQLPDRQRLALILHRYFDLSHKQITEVTGWSQSAVESCLVRAYDRLREVLADLKST